MTETISPSLVYEYNSSNISVYGHLGLSNGEDVNDTLVKIFFNNTLANITSGTYWGEGKHLSSWYNTSWSYRKPVYILERNNTNLTDFTFNVTLDTRSLILAGKMRSDCGDLRFSDSSQNELGYWIENQTSCNTTSTIAWVKIPYLSSNSSNLIYFYYGNPSVINNSNGSAALPFLKILIILLIQQTNGIRLEVLFNFPETDLIILMMEVLVTG